MRQPISMSTWRGLCLLLWAGVVAAQAPSAPPWLGRVDLDLVAYLPPPAVPGSPAELAERAQVLEVQRRRTPAMAAAAQRDQEISPGRFADVLGEGFTEAQFPKTFALAQRLCRDAAVITGAAKVRWQRPRPYVVEPAVRPVVAVSTDGSYPSGHATCGYLWAMVLGEVFPDRRAALFARGIDYGNQRLVGGVHYPSDIEAGHLAAVAILATLRGREAFEAALADARAEAQRTADLTD
jgi:acid phosphatase (class A)